MRIIDLTLELYSGIKGLPGFKLYERNPVKVEVIACQNQKQLEGLKAEGKIAIADDVEVGYLAMSTRLQMTAHNGTHIDAPRHFMPDGPSVDKLNLEYLFADGVIFDLSYKEADSPISAQDIENTGTKVKPNEIPIIKTCWTEKMYGKPDFYDSSPYFLPEVAEWFVEKKVKAVACDCFNDLKPWRPNPDRKPGDHLAPCHTKFLGNGIILIELLTNLSMIKKDRVKLIALPLKLRGAEASPARVIAIEE